MPQVGTGYSDYIGTRPSTTNPTQTEYYNKKTNEGFSDPGGLAAYASSLNPGQSVTPDNVFSVVEKGFTPTPPAPTTINSTTPPTSTSLPELPNPTAPSTTSAYITSAQTDLENKRKAVEDAYNKQLADIKTQQDAAQKKIDELNTTEQNTIQNDIQPLLTPFRQTLETTQRDQLKVNENFQANQKLIDEMSSLLNQGNEAINQAKMASGPSAILNGRINQVISDVSARAGVIQAVLAARNGQIAQAYNMIDRSVQATYADRQDQLTYYNTLLKFYDKQKDDQGNKLLDLTNEERKYVDDKITLVENDLQNAQKTADYIKSLMVDPQTAKTAADAGITLNDTVEQINKKFADQTKRIEVQTQQKANREEAQKAGITAQFYNKGGLIVRTSDGFEFSSEQQFQQMTGMTLKDAEAKGMVANPQSKANVLSTTVDKNGVVRSVVLDPNTGNISVKIVNGENSPNPNPNNPNPSPSPNPAPQSKNFTKTQLAKGAANSGLTIDEFKRLSADQQNQYINGPLSKSLTASETKDSKAYIDESLKTQGLGAIRDMIDHLDIPQPDKEALKQYAEDKARQ